MFVTLEGILENFDKKFKKYIVKEFRDHYGFVGISSIDGEIFWTHWSVREMFYWEPNNLTFHLKLRITDKSYKQAGYWFLGREVQKGYYSSWWISQKL